MNALTSTKRFASSVVLLMAAFSGATTVVLAQDVTAPTPAPAASPTLMDREYDGQTHITLAPYIWLPTVHGSVQYTIPKLPLHAGHSGVVNFTTAPAAYVSKLNSAAMGAVDLRKGDFDIFGDYIYTNATASANATATISGPLGRRQHQLALGTSARLVPRIWEAAAGYTVARGHDADLSIFLGVREFPINLTLGYNAAITGRRGTFTTNGTVTASTLTNDVITGLRGKAFFGDGHIFVPYYIDFGTSTGPNNQTWEGYTGAGYAFNHGQTLIVTYRTLNYFSFPPNVAVQKLNMSGPLLGYTFNL
ncbi:MAG: hypothetical protein WA304_08120 [Candidatus Cybelea sp.]